MNRLTRAFGIPMVGVVALAGGVDEARALDLGVFGDLSYITSNAPGDEPNFRIGSLDFYASQYIDDKTRALFELQFQTFSGDFTYEIQRFEIMREFSDAFRVGLGRFHTPLGYWNHHYHHGILMQDTVSRPFVLSFEGGATAFIPMHMIGAMVNGDLASGIQYEAAVANSGMIDSTTSDGLVVPIRDDLSPNKSYFARLNYDAPQVSFKPGVFGMVNDVVETGDGGLVGRGDNLVKQQLVGLDLRYERDDFDLLAEFYHLENDLQPGVGDADSHTALAYFTQFGYRPTERWKATYRYETIDFDDDDAYFTDPNLIGMTQTQSRNVLCLRYDFSESNAMMLEFSRVAPDDGDKTNTVILSWAFVVF